MTHIFLNYAEADANLAKRIYADLLAKGIKVWAMDFDCPPGEDVVVAGRQALEMSDTCLVLMTKKYMRVPGAVQLAEWAQEAGKTVIPIIADRGVQPPAGMADEVNMKRRYAQAIDILAEKLPMNTEPAEELPIWQAGNEAYALQDYDEAIALYQDIDESDPIQLHSRAAAANALRKHAEALLDLNKAVELAPDSDLIRRNRSVALGGLGEHEKALDDDKHALKINDQDPRNWSNYAMTLAALERFDEARDAITQAVDLVPDNERYLYQKGVVLARAGDNEAALEALETAIALDESYEEALAWRRVVWGRLGRHEEALEEVTQAIRKNPQRGGPYITRALLNFYLERYDDTIQDANAAIERSEQHYLPGLFNRAIAYWKLGDTETAMVDYAEAMALLPELGTEAGIRNNAESELTSAPALEILAAIEQKAKEAE
ncbi:MAG: toll/interleukin-1 receptor domain-containing protein [Anaerolineales bacterium]